jgi:hypothetical protein
VFPTTPTLRDPCKFQRQVRTYSGLYEIQRLLNAGRSEETKHAPGWAIPRVCVWPDKPFIRSNQQLGLRYWRRTSWIEPHVYILIMLSQTKYCSCYWERNKRLLWTVLLIIIGVGGPGAARSCVKHALVIKSSSRMVSRLCTFFLYAWFKVNWCFDPSAFLAWLEEICLT